MVIRAASEGTACACAIRGRADKHTIGQALANGMEQLVEQYPCGNCRGNAS